MQRSTDRILTTHAGSLPRPQALIDLNSAKLAGNTVDEAALARELQEAVSGVVRRQAEAGISVVDDGELGKASRSRVDFGPWQSYAFQRLGGWETLAPDAEPPARPAGQLSFGVRRDWQKFAEFYDEYRANINFAVRPAPTAGVRPSTMSSAPPSIFTGPITYTGQAAIAADIANLKAALQGANVSEAFMCAVAPGSFARGLNYYYKTDEEYLYALAEAMREEYRAIIDAGFVLQLDDPGLPDSWDSVDPAPSLAEYKKYATQTIEALNHGLRDLPQDRIRYHICWGSWQGPHTTDIPLADVADLLLSVNAGAYSVEAGNVRHGHEWRVWKDVKLPDGKLLIPGIVSHKTNVVEHPRWVADRILEYASVVGRENVIAGTDCGLGGRIHPSLAWAKLESLAEGAAIASKELW